jgi:hypothetical protein
MKKHLGNFTIYFFVFISVLFSTQRALANPQAEIWDASTSSWTTTFADGDFIDKVGTESYSSGPQMAVDGNGVVYVAYEQVLSDGLNNHIFLSRYNGTRAEIWDTDTRAWVTDFSLGDPIDTGTANDAANVQIAIDSNNKVYVTYSQSDGVNTRVYLTHYTLATGIEIWNSDAPAGWTTTMGNGDPVDGGTIFSAGAPQIVIDYTNKVYVAYTQNNGASLYLSRYNGTDVRIWDNDTANWVTDLTLGDSIDNALGTGIAGYQIARDSNNNIYAVYSRSSGAKTHIYLSRYNAVSAWTEVWDNGTPGWTTDFASGDPIDTGLANSAITPQLAVDSSNNVYVVYVQSTGTKNHIFLSRYDGTDVRIWDNGGSAWTNVFANGDPIDYGSNFNVSSSPQLVIDSTGKVYITYSQFNGIPRSIYLSRYNGTTVEIWDSSISGWTTTFSAGDPIDAATGGSATEPKIARDSENNIYITFNQLAGANSHVYLSRYNGTDVRIWDTGNLVWMTYLPYGDPIDTGTANDAYNPQIVTDVNDNAYITFRQNSGTKYRTYLSRFYVMMPTISNQGDSNQGTSTVTINGRIEKVGGENATIRGFEYGLDDTYGGVFSELGSYGVGDFSHEITDLSLNTLYHFRVFAGNSFGMSSSTSWTVSSMANPPLNPAVTSVTRSTVSFSWAGNSNPDLTNYAIYNETIDATSTPATGLTATLTGLICGTAYDFEVRSINQDDRSSIGAAVSTSTAACPDESDPQVQIWDGNADSWTTTFVNGDPVDTGLGFGSEAPQLATDSNSNVYVVYSQADGDYFNRIYLSRYNGTTIEIWDNGTLSWVTDLSLGDPIDPGNDDSYYDAQIAVDSQNRVYVTYTNDSGGRVYLSRYNGTRAEIWSNSEPAGWTATFSAGDPIDNPGGPWGEFPQIAIDSNDYVYVTYSQVAADDKYHIYLSRYNGESVQIWNNTEPAGWTTTLADGDPVDIGLSYDAFDPQIAIATSTDYVYVTYSQGDAGGNLHIYLSRYNGANVQIWDNGTPGWTSTFSAGDPIDNTNNSWGIEPQIVTDSVGRAYITYSDDSSGHVYLSRYNGSRAEIWDAGTSAWSNVFTSGDSIDNPGGSWGENPQIAVDAVDNIYVVYSSESDEDFNAHTYLTRYNGSEIVGWDTDTAGWAALSFADPVDRGVSYSSKDPQIAIDPDNNVYLTYVQDDGSRDRLYLTRYDGSTVKIWDTNSFSWTATLADGGTIDNGTNNSAWYPQISSAPNKDIYMVYQQSSSGDDQIYLSRYFPGSGEIVPEPDPTCDDGIQNQDETGVDSGGVCAPDPEPTPDPEPQPVARSSGSGGTHFGCKDPKATNYEFFSSHRQSLCQYALIPTTPPITIQISTSTATTTKYLFTRNLKLYMTGPDVLALQQYLNTQGFTVSTTGPGSKGAETTMFGGKTQAALIKFQKANGITPAVGYFGPVTRGWVGR